MAEIWRADKRAGKKTKKKKSAKLRKIRRELYRLLGKEKNTFGSFVARPRRLCFENQLPKEKTILLLRPHWVTNFRWIVIAVLLFFAPLFFGDLPLFAFLPPRFNLVMGMMWYLFVFAFILERFFTWYFSVNIITDERIVDIDFVSLIHKRISDAEIENIEDVTYKMGGILGTMLDFGTVYVQTAAERPEFEFEKVPKPALVVKVLQRLRLEEKQEALEGRLN